MKIPMTAFCLAILVTGVQGQGLVRFANSDSTLISVFGPYPYPPVGPLPANAPGTYLFALLTAPAGDFSLDDFHFTGNYATNTAAAGRISGGPVLGITVDTWAPGQTRNFMVVGWPSFYGSDFQNVFGGMPVSSYLSYCSSIGTGAAGGTLGDGSSVPTLNIFGDPPSIGGFVIYRIPEPAFGAVLALSVAAVLILRRAGNGSLTRTSPTLPE